MRIPSLLALAFLAMGIVPAKVQASEVVLQLVGDSEVSFGQEAVAALPSGAEIRFALGSQQQPGTYAVSLAQDVELPPVTADGVAVQYTIKAGGGGWMRRSASGVLEADITTTIEAADPSAPGAFRLYSLRFTSDPVDPVPGETPAKLVTSTFNAPDVEPVPADFVVAVLNGSVTGLPD